MEITNLNSVKRGNTIAVVSCHDWLDVSDCRNTEAPNELHFKWIHPVVADTQAAK